METTSHGWLDLARELRTLGQLIHAGRQRAWSSSHGLAPAVAGLLAELAAHGECRISALARHRLVDVSVISRQIAQLERAGLVARRPDPSDGRVALVRITESGREALRHWRDAQISWLHHALSKWDEGAVRTACAVLGAMNDELHEALTATGPTELTDVLEGIT
ncbi:transcriptional regulator [Longimycelium tulufanense]|uniref:Transcriptional regulator n=1 Tax=Longimycelium tulufanense TaxID=907463 RepID=A0A8J3C7B7_9PSEU|nr:MarR family transcriptional regulator [Longimycelium tulufanense]GGM47428.1 transcriptional regulator [Longimycelium tulufanense]